MNMFMIDFYRAKRAEYEVVRTSVDLAVNLLIKSGFDAMGKQSFVTADILNWTVSENVVTIAMGFTFPDASSRIMDVVLPLELLEAAMASRPEQLDQMVRAYITNPDMFYKEPA